jgi:hypothetical protein
MNELTRIRLRRCLLGAMTVVPIVAGTVAVMVLIFGLRQAPFFALVGALGLLGFTCLFTWALVAAWRITTSEISILKREGEAGLARFRASSPWFRKVVVKTVLPIARSSD